MPHGRQVCDGYWLDPPVPGTPNLWRVWKGRPDDGQEHVRGGPTDIGWLTRGKRRNKDMWEATITTVYADGYVITTMVYFDDLQAACEHVDREQQKRRIDQSARLSSS